MDRTIVEDWLARQRRRLPDLEQALVLARPPGQATLVEAARWPADRPLAQDLERLATRAITLGEVVAQGSGQPDRLARIAVPIAGEGGETAGARGALALDFGAGGAGPRAPLVAEAVLAGEIGGLLLRAGDAAGQGAAAVPAWLLRALAQPSPSAFALALVTGLAQAFDCERVSLGLVRRGAIRVEAISGQSVLDPRSGVVRDLAARMQRAAELKPEPDVGSIAGAEDNDPEAGDTQDAGLALPLVDAWRSLGVLLFEPRVDAPDAAPHEGDRRSPGPSTELREQILALGAVLTPILRLLQRDRLPVWRRAVETLRARVGWGEGGGVQPRRAAIALLATLLLVGPFLPMTHRVSARASIEGAVHRALVAPFDGYVERAEASAGDVVEEGQLLASLQERDLDLERERRRRERDEFARLYDRALSKLDHSEARVLTARRAQAELSLQLLEEQRARTKLVAPFDGVVLSGDLDRSLGAPVERGELLFEVAPLDDYRVVLQVDERDVATLAPGQPGRLVLKALPAERFDLVVEKVTPVAEVVEGRNTFRVEARLEGDPAGLRPGMEGVGKVEVGRRPLYWIALHDFVDWLRLRLWAWGGWG